MPQEHYVLKCFSCDTFQAHIVKKSKKWECKMCGAKQSVKRNYGKGSAKDCRNQVMKLNELRVTNSYNINETEENFCDDSDLRIEEVKEEFKESKPLTSKWLEFLEEPETITDNEGEDDVPEVCLMLEKKKRKRVKKTSGNCTNNEKKICLATTQEAPPNATIIPVVPPITQNLESSKSYENTLATNNLVQTKHKIKTSKYAKYIDEEDKEKENDFKKTNTSSNVFDSNTTDLDSILSFE